MSALSDFLEAGILNHIFRNTDIGSPPANVYIALFTTATTDAGGGTEVANSFAYARATVSTTAQWNAPGVGGSTSNVNEIAFTAASGGNWGTVTHVAITDSATYGAGNWYFHGPLAASQAVNDGDVFRFVAGALVVTLA